MRVLAPQRGLTPGGVNVGGDRARRSAPGWATSPHRLRHTAATEMLRGGATLPEIGQVLRHRRLLTTAIYAKVDRERSASWRVPWPVGSVS